MMCCFFVLNDLLLLFIVVFLLKVCGLSQLMLDPYYRTIDGFQVHEEAFFFSLLIIYFLHLL